MHDVYIAIGGNLVPDGYSTLVEGLQTAVQKLQGQDIIVKNQSSWYQTAAMPVSDQPDFLNAVLRCQTRLNAEDTLKRLQILENEFGRVRTVRNAARVLDLDILDFDGIHLSTDMLETPHPRLQDRAFVLFPLQDVAPQWVHPLTGAGVNELIENLPHGQVISKIG